PADHVSISTTIGANTPIILGGSAGLTTAGVTGGNSATTLTLNGSAVHSFTGGLNLTGGTLALDFANLATPTDLIASGNALAIGGGALTLKGHATVTPTNQTFASTTVNAGGSGILVNPVTGTGTTVNLKAITATAAGSSLVVGKSVGAPGTATLTTTTNMDASGIYGGRIVFADGTANTGFNWASNTGGVGPTYTLSAYSGYAPMVAGATSDTLNDRITGAGITLTGAHTHNSLKLEGSSGTLDIRAFGWRSSWEGAGV
ncbi:MAG: hypothetical protein NTV46_01450, partial [Verrucomicrobia bacterium]|nr:hypothetical protein [Verrucomicrobiota bacterium]